MAYIYRVSRTIWDLFRVQVEWTKRSRKVLYHFTIFAIVKELLIIKNRRISPPTDLWKRASKMRPPPAIAIAKRMENCITSDNGYARTARDAGPTRSELLYFFLCL